MSAFLQRSFTFASARCLAVFEVYNYYLHSFLRLGFGGHNTDGANLNPPNHENSW